MNRRKGKKADIEDGLPVMVHVRTDFHEASTPRSINAAPLLHCPEVVVKSLSISLGGCTATIGNERRSPGAASNGKGPCPVSDRRIGSVCPVHEYVDLAMVASFKLTKLVYENRIAVVLDVLPHP